MAGELVLIVDDNAANLKLARLVLSSEGFTIQTAVDAEQALRVLETCSPRAILMDIQLPGMDGLELTRRLKADPKHRATAIIALTAYAMKGDEERALVAGCDGYIAKPIDPDVLPRLVREHIARAPAPPAPERPRSAPILLVEDNPTARKMFRMTLEFEGLRVLEAPDGTTALALMAEEAPAVVLLDLLLPDMNGMELNRRLRALPGGSDVPMIALSGFHGFLDEARTLPAGFDAFLVKPVDPAVLVGTVARFLPLAQAHESIGKGRTLLIVDDDPVQLKLARLHFASLGFRVSTAADGEEGLAVAQSSLPAGVLSDVLIPGIDGFALCLALRRDSRTARLPVVLVSAHYREDADLELARAVGASAFVVRTPDYQQVVDAVTRAIDEGAPRPPAETAFVGEAHKGRVLRQLERQVAANEGLAQRCALQAAQLSILGSVADALARSADVPAQLLGDVLGACLDAGGISRGALYRREDESGKLVLAHAVGFGDQDREALAAAFGEMALLEEVVATETVLPLPSAGVRAERSTAFLASAGVASALIVPVVGAGRSLGVLLLGSSSTRVADADLLAFGRAMGAYVGQALALAATFADRNRALERAQAARWEAEAASRAKDEFLAMASHELRTPLTALLSWAHMLRGGRLDKERQERALRVIEESARAEARLVSDLLDSAQIVCGTIQLESAPFDVAKVVAATVDAMSPEAAAKEIPLEVTLPREAPLIVQGDAARIGQVARNLLSNAIKFTPRGGRIEVRLEGAGTFARLTVADTGQGFEPAFQAELFQRFRQADRGVTRAFAGFGLGLSLCKSFVEKHGGKISGASEGQGKGAVFTVDLPLADLRHAPDTTPRFVRRLDGARVLAVEDHEETRHIVALILETAGAVVHSAATAAEALAVLEAFAPTVIVSDISMPGEDGLQLIREVRRRESPADRRTPAMALTARAQRAEIDAALAAGYDRHLAKPFSPDVLVDVIARLVEGRVL